MIAAIHVDLNNVDFPPMFGPVIKRLVAGLFILTSFGTKGFVSFFFSIIVSTQGCLIYFKMSSGFEDLA